MMRTLYPGNLPALARIRFRHVWKPFLVRRPTDVASARRMERELLCTEAERKERHFRIVHPDPGNALYALSEHVVRKFPDFDWPALEYEIRLRIDQLPRITIRGVLEYLATLFAVSSAFHLGYRFLESLVPALGMFADRIVRWLSDWIGDSWNDLVSGGLIAVFHLLVAFLAFRALAYSERKRFQGAAWVLRYIAIRARAGKLPAAGQGPDGQG